MAPIAASFSDQALGPVAGLPQCRVQYDSHMPTTPLQKIVLSVTSALTVFTNPERGDMLAALGEVTARILAEKPVIRNDRIDMDYLRALPDDSFGRHYATFMDSHGFDADGRSLYASATAMLGEIALKYVEMAHSKLPVSALSAFVGPLRLSSEERCLLMKVYVPWANRASKNAHSLHCVMYEEEFKTPIESCVSD
ncbi:Ubiquinone biosynthesis protein Coq4 [Phytophthora cactorum]|nr:Ubiquinone biosynthesis protein Coq4 [Phytophthora cactorum]